MQSEVHVLASMLAEASSLVVLQVFLFADKRFATVAVGAPLCAIVERDRSEMFALGAAQRAASNRPLPGAVAALFL